MGLSIKSETFFSVNPRNGEVLGTFTPTDPDEISNLVHKARSAFHYWASLSLKTRMEITKKAYREFYRHQDEIASLISQETGKPLVEAYSCEILPILDGFKYYLRTIKPLLKPQKITSNNPLFKLRKGYVVYEPLGVIAVISPWNYPFLLSMQHIIPALLTGNAVVHKPSEFTTLTSLKIREIFDKANLPRDVFQVVTGLADVGQALVNSKLDKIYFTGSTTVGQKIYEAAAKQLIPVNLELGGSDPMIVLEDANLERAASAAIWGAFVNTGQACVSVERLYVQESIHQTFLDLLLKKLNKIRFSANYHQDGEISCLVNEQQFNKISRIIEDALAKGAVIKFGGKPRKDLGTWYYEPTVLTRVNTSMKLLKEECFGPVLAVIPFENEEEAIALANHSEYGLSASIWTQNRKRGQELAHHIQSGSVLINDLQIHIAQPEAPYLGYKKSGLGVSHGPWGVMEMVHPKYINYDRPWVMGLLKWLFRPLADHDPWWYPYTPERVEDFKNFAIFLHSRSLWQQVKVLPKVLKALFRKDYL